MKKEYEYKKIIPKKYHNVSYETDVSVPVKNELIKQIQKEEGLYLWGESGVGKTHIACALAKNILEKGFNVRFFNTGDFLEQLREEFDKGFDDEYEYLGLFRETMNFRGVLILDDIGAEKATDWVKERLYLIINKRYEDMLPTIFTSNFDLEILSARLGDRIASRIGGMTSRIRIPGQDKRLSQNMNMQNNETN